ncbi:MAG: UDP-N-acetylglucosamine--LPS N-acetylglucosamine transferase [Marinosulfonomonas sp.]
MNSAQSTLPQKNPRVLVVASGGGHWVQLCRLAPSWDNCRVTYVSTDPGFRNEVERLAAERGQPKPAYTWVTEANRWEKWRLVKSLLWMIWVVLRVRPDIVITTGAAPGYFALRLGRLFGARTIWLDSIANGEALSLSGQMAGKYADLWLTQWEHLAGSDGTAPEFRGSVI